MKKVEFDENGVEVPQGYLFGKIPYYSNRNEDVSPFWLALGFIPLIIALRWDEFAAAWF